MKKIYTVFLLFIVATMLACYEDKGNYDYEDISELAISFDEYSYSTTFGEEVKIEPKFNIEIPEDSPRYSYIWYLNGETRPEWNKRIFTWTADEVFKRGNVDLEVTDLKMNIVYMYRTSLNVTGIYENEYSWIILSDMDGKSHLSYFSNLEYDDEKDEFKKTKFYNDIYTSVNGEELGTGPIALQVHFRQGVNYKDEVIGNVCVFQKSGAVDLSGESFEKQIDMIQAFDGGKYPEGAIIYPGTFMDRVDVLSDQRGRLYSRFKASSYVYNSEYFLPTPLCYEDETEPVEKCQVGRGFYRANRTGYAFVYDGKNKRMLYVVNSGYSDEIAGAGKLTALPACGENDKIDEIVPLDNMNGYELIKMAMFGYGYPNYGYFLLLREESTNKVFLQIVKVTGSNGRPKIVEVKLHELKGLPGVPTLAAFPQDRPEYAFFAVGQEVYYVDLNNIGDPVEPYKSFNAKITAMNAESPSNAHMAVGLENGEFYILQIWNAKNTPEEKRIIYPVGEGAYPADNKVGRIVDIQYKQLDHWNY